MKTRIFYTLLFLLLSGSFAMAQDDMFRVLASKGKNTLQTTGTADWKPVFVGKQLKKSDKITIAENGYLGLAHKSGKTIELRKAGTYDVSKLAGEVSTQNASAQKKYVDYLASEAKKNEDNNMARDRYKYMQATGSVERAVGYFGLFTHNKDTVVSGKINLKWDGSITPGAVYVVSVMNYFDEAISAPIETTNNFATVTLDPKAEKTYKISVSLKDDSEKKSECTIVFLEPFKAENVRKQAADLQSVLGSQSALNKIVLASYYEDQRLYLDAMGLYEEAIKMEPEVEDYQIAYGQFLERTKLAEVKTEKKDNK
jgi:hypothetical protein